MHIAICEDNYLERRHLLTHIRCILERKRIKAYIRLFSNGTELLDKAEDFTVYFLDIYLEDMSGVQIAYKIRQMHPDALIVFTTASPDYMAEGYDIGALHYLLKPLDPIAVENAVNRILQWTRECERYITLHIERIEYKTLLSSIVVIESCNKSCTVTTTNTTLKPYIKLGDMQTLLDDNRFLRCHRSFLINMDYVCGIEKNCFLMKNNMSVPIKRDRQLQMKQQYAEYCFYKLRKEMHPCSKPSPAYSGYLL